MEELEEQDYRSLSAEASKRRTTLASKIIFGIVLVFVVLLILESFGAGLALTIIPRMKNTYTHHGGQGGGSSWEYYISSNDWSGDLESLFITFGSWEKDVRWKPQTLFNSLVTIDRTIQGSTVVSDGTFTSIKLWIQNQTALLDYYQPTNLFYSVNTVMDGLVSDALAAFYTVNPLELSEFLASMFRRRSVAYSNEFISYLSLIEANVTALQNATAQVLVQNMCRGKPLESTLLVPLGDQTLPFNQTQSASWGSLSVMPSPPPSVDFAFSGPTIRTLLDGVYAITTNVNLVIPANTTGLTSVSLMSNGTAAFQTFCQIDQPSVTVPGSAQCQGTSVLSLTAGTNLTLALDALYSQVIYTASNSRIMLTRVC